MIKSVGYRVRRSMTCFTNLPMARDAEREAQGDGSMDPDRCNNVSVRDRGPTPSKTKRGRWQSGVSDPWFVRMEQQSRAR